MPKTRNRGTLGEWVKLVRGTTYKGNLVGEPGPVLLGLSSISPNGGFRRTNFDTYGGDCAENIVLKSGDIYVSLKDVTQSADLLGAVARLPKDISSGRLTQDTVRLIATRKDTPWGYIYWLLRTPQYRNFCWRYATGTTTLGLGREDFLGYPVPDFTAQRRSIVQALEAIERRHEELSFQSETLEAIPRAIFKSWFVDFDPVRAKAEGREPDGMDADTAALFPRSFLDSELGTMPDGWKWGCISDLCETLTNGGTPSRSKPELWQNGSIQWFKTGELKDGFLLNSDELISEEAVRCSSTKMLPRHAVLVALYGATIGRLGILTSASTFNQACTGMVARQDVGPWYLFLFLRNAYEALRNLGNGAAQQNISKAIVERFPVPVPCPSILAAFNWTVEPLFLKIESNSQMQQNLTTLRDTLLPRLISGKLRVPEAEAMLTRV